MNAIQQRGDRFVLSDDNGGLLAEITFQRPSSGTIIIDHTYVSEALGGQGIGKQLVFKVADLALAEGSSLDATCPFAKRVLDRR